MLVTSFPGRGHLNPVLPLAIAAQQAGHDVRVATGADQLAHVTRYELEPVEIGPGLDDLIDATRRGYGTPGARRCSRRPGHAPPYRI